MHPLEQIWRVYTRDPVGSLLTVVGVVLGSAALVFLASGLEGAGYAMARTSQRAAGDDVVRIVPERPEAGEVALFPLSDQDAHALRDKEGLPDERVSASVTLYEQEATVGGETMPVGVQSGGARWMRITGLELLHGRMLNEHDDGERRCVVGYDVWKRLYGGKWPVERPSLLLDGATKMHVVGVLKRRPPIGGGSGGETWRVDRKLFVTNATLERAVKGGPHEKRITIRYDEQGEDARATSLRLEPYVTALHRGVRNFSFVALGKGMALDKVITAALMAVLALGGLLAIVVGGINVMNAQLMTVGERAQELAIRRALGLSADRLRREVLFETVAMTGAGAVMGIGLGLVSAWGLSRILTALVAPWPFSVVPWSLGAAVVACVTAGLVAGWIPARRASELPPALVLRGE